MLKKIAVVALAALLLSVAVSCNDDAADPQTTQAETQGITQQENVTDGDAVETVPTETPSDTQELLTSAETILEDASDETLSETLDETLAETLADTEAETESEAETEAETESEDPVVIVNSSSRLAVSDKAYLTSHVNASINTLKTRIKNQTGMTLSVSRITSTSTVNDGAIVVGDAPCSEAQEAKAALPANSYTVTVKNNKIVILGSDDSLTAYAMAAFCEQILSSPEMTSNGCIRIPVDFTYTKTLEAPLTFVDMLQDGFKAEAVRTFVLKAAPVDDCSIAQGAASDGTYAYLALRNADDTAAVIAKVRMSDGKTVAVSEKLALGHANDMTYNTKTNTLVVVHGQDEGYIVTMVNPETLTVIKDVTIEKKAGAITYNPTTDTYAIGRGGKKLHILDGDLSLVKSYDKTTTTGYTAQGMGSDDKYIYFPVSSASNNLLEAYDWDGNKVGDIVITTIEESESLIYVNGRYYVNFNVGGAQLYEVVFTAVFK